MFHYDKCAKKNSTKLWASPHRVLMQHREKIDDAHKVRIFVTILDTRLKALL